MVLGELQLLNNAVQTAITGSRIRPQRFHLSRRDFIHRCGLNVSPTTLPAEQFEQHIRGPLPHQRHNWPTLTPCAPDTCRVGFLESPRNPISTTSRKRGRAGPAVVKLNGNSNRFDIAEIQLNPFCAAVRAPARGTTGGLGDGV
jgi:hypothetical protein